MTPAEWRATASLSLVYGLRMLGMFMILPVFAIYAAGLPGSVAGWQVGLAIGVYGLTQAALQMPFGRLSDRFGRKPVIIGGLLVFAAGSLLAGLADSIEGIIAGRALQGAGAISAAVTALLADSTRESRRTTAMAVFGAGMGASFLLAMMLGPSLSGWIGVDGIFLATAVASLLALPLVIWVAPAAPPRPRAVGPLWPVLRDRQLQGFYAGIFLLHACLTAMFLALPFALQATLDLPLASHWRVYLPVMLLSLLPVFPLIRYAEAGQRLVRVFAAAVAVLVLAGVVNAFGHGSSVALLAGVLLFFLAFNFLEAALPSRLSRAAPVASRGTAMGLFATAQFSGAFVGGLLGGVLQNLHGPGGVFAACIFLPLVWLGFAARPGSAPPAGTEPDTEKENRQWREA